MTLYGDAKKMGMSEVLRGATDQIEKYGWVQCADHSVDGVDIETAVRIAAGVQVPGFCDLRRSKGSTGQLAELKANLAIELLESVVGLDVVEWNDQPGRKSEEVLRVLLDTADRVDIWIID